MKIVSKSQLAQTLEISKARISQYLKHGMPVRPDGKIDFDVAIKWIGANIVPLNPATGDKGAKRAARLTHAAAAKQRRAPPPPVYHDGDISALLGLVLNRAGPAIAEGIVAAGGSCEVAFAAVPIMRDLLSVVAERAMEETGHVVGSDDEPDGLRWGGMHGQPQDPDWIMLAYRAGETVDVEAWQRAEAALPVNVDGDDWRPAQPHLYVEV